MRRHFFLALIVFFSCFFSKAQQDPADSLKAALKTAKHDTTRCYILNQLVETSSDEEWPVFNEQLLKLAQNCSASAPANIKPVYQQYLAVALNNCGILAREKGDIFKALEYHFKGLKIQEEIKEELGVANSLFNIAYIYDIQGDVPQALDYFQKSLKIYEKINYKKGIAYVLNSIGLIYDNHGNIPKALEYYNKTLKMLEELGDKDGIAGSLNNIGFIYYDQGDVIKALEYYHKSLKIREEMKDKQGIAQSLNNIGIVYKAQNDLVMALEYYQRSLKIKEEIQDRQGIAYSLNNIGHIYDQQGNFQKALDYHFKSLFIEEEIDHKEGIANSLHNIGIVYQNQGNNVSALENMQKSLSIYEGLSDKQGICNSLTDLASVTAKMDKWDAAQNYALRSLQLAHELAFPYNIGAAAGILKKVYKRQYKFKEAFEMFELEIRMRDSITNTTTKKAALKKQFQYEYEKKEAVAQAQHKSDLEKQRAVADEKNRKQTITIWSVAAGLFLVMIFSVFIMRSLNTTRKQKLIIEIKNRETELQKRIIEEKQKDIIDSITYARRIQQSLLPSEKTIQKAMERRRSASS